MNHRIKVTTNRFLRYTQNGVYVPCTFVDEKREKDEYEWMFLVDKTKPLKIGTDIQQSLFNLEQLIKSRKESRFAEILCNQESRTRETEEST